MCFSFICLRRELCWNKARNIQHSIMVTAQTFSQRTYVDHPNQSLLIIRNSDFTRNKEWNVSPALYFKHCPSSALFLAIHLSKRHSASLNANIHVDKLYLQHHLSYSVPKIFKSVMFHHDEFIFLQSKYIQNIFFQNAQRY